MLAVAVALALVEPIVPSPPGQDPIRFVAPASCPDATYVRARVGDYLGGDASQKDVRIDATVEQRTDGQYHLEVVVETASGTTHHALTSPRCELLADAVALVAAVALDPVDVATAIEGAHADAPPPSPAIDVAPPPDVVAPPRVEPPPELPRRRPILRYGLRPELALDYGPLPGFSAGGGFTMTILSRGWRVEAGPVLLAPRRAHSQRVEKATAEIGLLAARVRGCGVFGRNLIEWPLCGGVELGVLRGRGTGATIDPKRESPLWAAAIVGPGLAIVPRRYIAIAFAIDAVFPFRRPMFELGDEEVHRARVAGVRGIVGVEIRVP